MSKTRAVELHLIEKGKITSWEAIKLYGATRLSAIIFNLRRRGLNIRTERVNFKDRFGHNTYYAEYILEED